MRPCYLLPLLCFAAIISVCLCGRCDVSAPEASLEEFVGECDHWRDSRTDACQDAMTQFCANINFPTGGTYVGVSRNTSTNQLALSCIKSIESETVDIEILQYHHGSCNLQNSQNRQCLIAMSAYCQEKYGNGYAGLNHGVSEPSEPASLLVHCFKYAHKETIPVDVLTSLSPYCNNIYPDSTNQGCFRAASTFCESYYGTSGGITGRIANDLVEVVCYDAGFTGDVFLTRHQDYYIARSEIKETCNISFDVAKARIVSQSLDYLKTETYDNSQSDIDLESSFDVAKEVTETSRFESSTLKFMSTTRFHHVQFPLIAGGGGSVRTGSVTAENIAEESSTTKRYVQSSKVRVPPKTKIVKEAKLSWGEMEVPWTATVVNGLGNVQNISGIWYGTSSYDLIVDQKNA